MMNWDLLNIFENNEEVIELSQVDEQNIRDLFSQLDAEGFCVEGIDCFDSDGIYFQSHIWPCFCPDYLVRLEGWHWKALKQHVISFRHHVNETKQDVTPVFTVTISRDFLDKDRADGIDQIVEGLMKDCDYRPKSFFVGKEIKVVEID